MKKKIQDIELFNKKVIIRCDFNVPIKDGKIIDDTRIIESLKTIEYAIEKGAKVILLSHLGRIKTEEDKQENSLYPVSLKLSEYLKMPVTFIKETRGKQVEEIVNNMKSKEVVLLENTRFEDIDGKKESTCDNNLSKYWASLGDIFINDAFGTIHRSHASNVGISKLLPNAIGFLVEKELVNLSKLDKPERPYYVILGGAKVSDKIGVIKNLVNKADYLIIGGAMSFTFLKSLGYEVGKSLIDEDSIDFCKQILKDYRKKIILPIDIVTSKEIKAGYQNEIKDINQLDINDIGLDIGPKTIEYLNEILKTASTVVWNGPLGYYELPEYQIGTKKVLEILVENKVTTILGGGDIVAAANQLGYKDKVTHASTGGGATLEYLEKKKLPGLEIIEEIK